MTVVKDDDVPEVEGGESVEAQEMSNSKLADDWSIIGTKDIDNEGSDGESVEVIPCEEEKAGESMEEAPQTEMAIETRENVMQTEEGGQTSLIYQWQLYNDVFWHPAGVVVFSVICHLLISMMYFAGTNTQSHVLDLWKGLPNNIHPDFLKLIEEWERSSDRSFEDKVLITNFLSEYFPWKKFEKEITELLEKDMGRYKEERYIPVRSQVHDHGAPLTPMSGDHGSPKQSSHEHGSPKTLPHDHTAPRTPPHYIYEDSSNKHNSDDGKFDCSSCKKYSSECKKFCKHKNKNVKYYYDKIIAPVVKKFSNFRKEKKINY